MSGIPSNLLDALDRRFEVVERVDYSPSGATRLALAAATFRPSRSAWRARFHTSRLARGVLSRTLSRRAGAVTEPFDIALQVLGWTAGQPQPYALYVDQTRLMAERGWPTWMPLTNRERSTILEAERVMYVGAAAIFVMSTSARESLIGEYDVEPSRITVVGGGLNFDALPEPRALVAAPVVLFVGREFERKGGEFLLQAFETVRTEVPEAALHIAGVRLSASGPGVIVHGRLGRNRLAELYRGSRVFCMPSRYEPWGLVFPEAMSYGIPCVGTTVQAIPEILDHGKAGLLVAPEDPQALAQALIALLRRRPGPAARRCWRRRVQSELLWDHVAERMVPAARGGGLVYSHEPRADRAPVIARGEGPPALLQARSQLVVAEDLEQPTAEVLAGVDLGDHARAGGGDVLGEQATPLVIAVAQPAAIASMTAIPKFSAWRRAPTRPWRRAP